MSESQLPPRSDAAGPSRPAGSPVKLSLNLDQLEEEAASLRTEWDKRFSADVFQNPLFVEVFVAALKKRDGLRLFEIVYRRAAAFMEPAGTAPFDARFDASRKALRTKESPPSGAVPIGFFEYLKEALDQAKEEEPSGKSSAPLETTDALVRLGKELIEDSPLSAFRIDILGAFSSTLTPPISVIWAPEGKPAPPKPPVRIELQSFIGKVFRGYKIQEPLGRGGFAAVFLAEHPTLPAIKRALKIYLDIDREGPGLEQFREKCLAEARLQSALKNEHIVEIIDVFEDQGYVVLVMEYVRGRNLAHLVREKNLEGIHLEPSLILDLAIPITRGLVHAHKLGIVHRDIKPENILIDVEHNGRPKLADFGLARHLEETGQRHSTVGRLVGTPRYMAPEQIAAKAKTYDRRCDIYSLGVVLYELANGVPPFDDQDRYTILQQHEQEAVESLCLKVNDFPEELDRIILTCLQKRPDDRFASADELLQALERCKENLGHGITTQSPEEPWERRKTGRRRKKIALAAGALALLVLAAISGYPLLLRWLSVQQPGAGLVDRKGPITLSSAQHDDVPGKEPERPASKPPPKEEGSTPAAPDRKDSELPARETADPKVAALPPKIRETPPPAPGLREKLSLQPAGPRAAALMDDLLGLFERRESDLHAASYDGLLGDLDTFEKERLHGGGAESVSSDEGYAASHSKAARRMLELARQAVRARLERLRTSNGSVVLKTAGGGTVSGKVQDLDETKISLRNDQGGTITVELSKLALEEFVPGAGAPAAELAFGGLTLHPARTLGQVLDFEENDESVLLWVPFLVRLARLEVRGQARDTALEAKDLLPKTTAVDDQVAVLVHHVAFEAAESGLLKEKPRVLPVYGYLDSDFALAQREKEALELLLHRRYSQVIASYRDTASGPVAGELLLSAFEKALEAGSEELFGGSGWWNNQWDIWPGEPDIKKRQKLFDTRDPKAIVLRDPSGPRSMIMNDNATRAPEGILLCLSFEPEPGHPEGAYWSFLLRAGKGRTDNLVLRVDATGIGLYRPVFEPGQHDECLAHAPLPPATGKAPVRSYAFVPGKEHLHVFVDRESVLCLPAESARIPNQLAFTVCYGEGTVRSMLAKKPLPAADGDGKKKKESEK